MLSRRRVKCCFIGDYNVGKTSVMYAFLDKRIDKVETTLGIDFFSKTIVVNDQDVYLSLWDTAGSERYRSLMHSYLRDADCIVVVYDTSLRESNLVHWMRIAEQHHAKVIGVLGNKTDLTTAFQGDVDELLFPWSRQGKKLVVGTCSSRKPEQVKSFMKECLKTLLQQQKESPIYVTIPIKTKSQKNNRCCT